MERAVDAHCAPVREADLPALAGAVGAEVEGVRTRVGEGAVEDAVVVDEPDVVAGRDGEQVRREARVVMAKLGRGARRLLGRRLGRLEVDDRAREVGGAEALAACDEAAAQRRGRRRRRRLGGRSLGPACAGEPEARDEGHEEAQGRACGGAAHPR
jgi:hypothetical protein